jgi:hypothetical protein
MFGAVMVETAWKLQHSYLVSFDVEFASGPAPPVVVGPTEPGTGTASDFVGSITRRPYVWYSRFWEIVGQILYESNFDYGLQSRILYDIKNNFVVNSKISFGYEKYGLVCGGPFFFDLNLNQGVVSKIRYSYQYDSSVKSGMMKEYDCNFVMSAKGKYIKLDSIKVVRLIKKVRFNVK